MKDSSPIFFLLKNRNPIPKKGRPNIQIIINGSPKAKDQIKWEFYQHYTVRSLVSKVSSSIVLQLNKLMILEDVLEYILKNTVINIITISHL